MKKRFILVFLLPLQTISSLAQSQLAGGVWYKIAIEKTGVYQLDVDFFKKNKINLKGFNPQNFRIFIGQNGMLPQANSAQVKMGLNEVPIEVRGEADGVFDKADAVLFYAESADKVIYQADKQEFTHQKNLYSSQNFVFLELSSKQGLRIKSNQNNGEAEAVSTFTSYLFDEKDNRNIVNSGREWMGDNIFLNQSLFLNFKIPSLVPNSKILLRSETMVATTSTADVELTVSGKKLLTHSFDPVGSGRFDIKGRLDSKTIVTTASQRDSVSVKYDFKPARTPDGLNSAVAYLNFVAVQTERRFQNFGEQTMAFLLKSKTKNSLQLNFATETEGLRCWRVDEAKQVEEFLIKDKKTTVPSAEIVQLQFFTNLNLFIPKKIEKVDNQQIETYQPPVLLILTAPAFRPQADELARFKQDVDGLETSVVSTDEIYNLMSGGRLDPVAIRNYIKLLYDKNPSKLKYVLLLGDATFDFRNIYLSTTFDAKGIVPTYESRESFHPVKSFSSDDFYGFMEADEGEWEETDWGNHTLELGIGRLPVKTPDEARIMINKLKFYHSRETFGPWRLNYSFLADDGDFNIHQQDAEDLSRGFEQKQNAGLTQKIYVDAFPQRTATSGVLAPAVNEEIRKKGLNSLIVNYNGHGGTSGFAEEKILTIADILSWKNRNQQPLLFTATCDFGRFDSPVTVSGAELALLNPMGGAIALCSTTRPVYSSSNFVINQAFFNALGESSDNARLGDVIRETKNNGLDDVYNRNFSLLGDPSLRLARPQLKVQISAPDTLKALQSVKLRGLVKLQNFNGKAVITVYDKPKQRTTFGTESIKFSFMNQESKIFEQIVDVKNSRFEVDWVVPKTIDNQFGKGLISCYAVNTDSTFDVAGFNREIIIGGTDLQAKTDLIPPKISFSVEAESQLRIDLFDESGFSILPSLLEQDPILVIDDTLKIPASELIKLAENDFRNAVVGYSLQPFNKGLHKANFKIRDTYNNLADASFEFRVIESPLRLKTVATPNPFAETVLIELENLNQKPPFEVSFLVFNELGQIFFEQTEQIVTAEEKLFFRWRPSPNIPAGKYHYGILLKNGNQQFKTSGGLIFSK